MTEEESAREVERIRSWLGSEFGYGNSTTGNTNRRLDEIAAKVHRNSSAIYGNGEAGLKTRVMLLEASNKHKNRTGQMAVSIGSVIVAIIAIIVAIVSSSS